MPSNDPPRSRPWDQDDRDDYDDRPRRKRDDDDYDDDRPRRREYDDRPPQAAGNGLATAALILGLLSLLTTCLTGIPAVICGLLALSKPVGKGMAVAGLLLGLLGTAAGIGLGVWAYFATTKSVRLAAARMTDANNMKQIGLAMHNQHDRHGKMLVPHPNNDRGKPNTGLSWRVGLLPYIEQDMLYKQFNMNEAWDSPSNKRPSNTAIKTYTTPFDDPGRASTETPYRVFVGGGALFDTEGEPVRLALIPDGTSNTIMAVHATEQVPWAAPRELKYDPNGPLPALGHPAAPQGFQVLMADGSVRFVSKNVSERTLRRAITGADGEALGADW